MSLDGPAGLVITDGRYAVCTLIEMGCALALVLTSDDVITVASEIMHDYDPATVVAKGRLGPGQILSVDTHTGALMHTADIDQQLKGPNLISDGCKKILNTCGP